MSRKPFILLAIAVWLTPAVLAAFIGWPGVWGSGSAFGDLLLPIPISGGILRLPSFLVALVILRAYSRLPSQTAALIRALCLAAALAGAVMLIDLERLQLALLTDYSGDALRLRRSYGGLSLLADGLWCFAAGLRHAPLLRAWPALVVAVSLPALWLGNGLRVLPGATSDGQRIVEFRAGLHRPVDGRADRAMFVYTGYEPAAGGFRQRAAEYADRFRPETSVNTEDVALHFTTELDATLRGMDAPIAATLCLYEDGTPDTWYDGDADCFSDHETLSDRLQRVVAALPDELPSAVRRYVVSRAMCEDADLPERYDDRLAVVDQCFRADLDALRAEALSIVDAAELDALSATLNNGVSEER